MTTDAPVVEQVTEESIEADDAAFAAAFETTSGERHDDVPAAPADPAATDDAPSVAEQFAAELDAEAAAAGAEGADGAQASDAAVQAAVSGLSSDEISALRAFLTTERGSLKQGLDKIAGNVGGLKRTLDQLQQVQRSQPQGSLAAEGARKISEKIQAAIAKNIANDYPELSGRLEATLTEALDGVTAPAAAPAIDGEEIDRRVADRFARLVVEDEHGEDWATKLALKDETGAPVKGADGKLQPSPHFRAFLAEKGEEFTQRFRSTDSPRLISRTISEYESWRATQSGQSTPAQPASTPAAPAQEAAAAPVARPGSNKQARLAAAVTPRGNAGGGSPTLTEDDAFELGFRSARGAL